MTKTAAHLLSNYYNLTRDQYYRELQASSQTSSTQNFLTYAAQGLVDGLREQIDIVRAQQLSVSWANYMNETMDRFPASQANSRQRALVSAMPFDKAIARGDLTTLTPSLAALYANTGPRTLSRDLNRLSKAGLIVRDGRNWKASTNIMFTFMPLAAF